MSEQRHQGPELARQQPGLEAARPAPVSPNVEFTPDTGRDVGGAGGGPAAPSTPPRKGGSGWVKVAAAAAVAVVVGLALFNGPKPPGDETKFPNWNNHVSQLNKDQPLKHVSRAGVGAITTQIKVTAADRDAATTTSVKAALQSNDVQKAQAALQAAQQIPVVEVKDEQGQPVPIPKPEPKISPGLAQEVISGDAEFVHIFLFDACAEDGDVVEIQLNGEPFAVVPITHQGATLSVPVSSKTTTQIALRGIHDGGGGITVACRTSLGDHFARAMFEGEVQPLGTVGP